jgi:hypothetical protein
MIDGNIAVGVATITSDLMLDYYSPNEDLLKCVSGFDVNDLDTVDDITLSKFVVVLGQFLVYINYNENLVKISSIEAEKHYDRNVMKAIAKIKWKTGITLKEKKAFVADTNEEVEKLEREKDECKYKVQMYHGLYNTVLEYMNTYKREQSRRQSNEFKRQ